MEQFQVYDLCPLVLEIDFPVQKKVGMSDFLSIKLSLTDSVRGSLWWRSRDPWKDG